MNKEMQLSKAVKIKEEFCFYMMVLSWCYLNYNLFFISEVKQALIYSIENITILITSVLVIITVPINRSSSEDNVNANKHYNKGLLLTAFLGIISTTVMKAILNLSHSHFGYFEHYNYSWLLLIIFGLMYLIHKHEVYLNESFISSDRKEYFSKVFNYIGIMNVFLLGTFIFTHLLIYSAFTNTYFKYRDFLITDLFISMAYLLHSIYEYNVYNEKIDLEKNNNYLLSKNLILYWVLSVLLLILSFKWQSLFQSSLYSNKEIIFQMVLLIVPLLVNAAIAYSARKSLYSFGKGKSLLTVYMILTVISATFGFYQNIVFLFENTFLYGSLYSSSLRFIIAPELVSLYTSIKDISYILCIATSIAANIFALIYICKNKLPAKGFWITGFLVFSMAKIMAIILSIVKTHHISVEFVLSSRLTRSLFLSILLLSYLFFLFFILKGTKTKFAKQ